MATPDSISSDLRTEILSLHLPPGTPLREIELAERFQASRRSVREALLTLSRERIVSHERNRGARVRVLGTADIDDLYHVRQTLETEGARSCATAPASALAKVAAAFSEFEQVAAHEPDSIAHALADMRFHAAVIALCGSERFDDFFETLSVEMAYAIRILHRYESGFDLRAADIDEHRNILESILARDAAESVDHVTRHIQTSSARLHRVNLSRAALEYSG